MKDTVQNWPNLQKLAKNLLKMYKSVSKCLKRFPNTKKQGVWRTDGQTDGPTDRQSDLNGVACTRLKITLSNISIIYVQFNQYAVYKLPSACITLGVVPFFFGDKIYLGVVAYDRHLLTISRPPFPVPQTGDVKWPMFLKAPPLRWWWWCRGVCATATGRRNRRQSKRRCHGFMISIFLLKRRKNGIIKNGFKAMSSKLDIKIE